MEKATFLQLLDKYFSGEASLEEEQQLLNFYESFNKSGKTLSDLDTSSLDDKMFNRLVEGIEMDNPGPSSRGSFFKKISIAATLVIATAASLYFFANKEKARPEYFAEISPKNDIDPGNNNKAILTLADGSKISLDDAAKGFVARQGNTSITKTEDKQIVYIKNIDDISGISGRSAANTWLNGLYGQQ